MSGGWGRRAWATTAGIEASSCIRARPRRASRLAWGWGSPRASRRPAAIRSRRCAGSPSRRLGGAVRTKVKISCWRVMPSAAEMAARAASATRGPSKERRASATLACIRGEPLRRTARRGSRARGSPMAARASTAAKATHSSSDRCPISSRTARASRRAPRLRAAAARTLGSGSESAWLSALAVRGDLMPFRISAAKMRRSGSGSRSSGRMRSGASWPSRRRSSRARLRSPIFSTLKRGTRRATTSRPRRVTSWRAAASSTSGSPSSRRLIMAATEPGPPRSARRSKARRRRAGSGLFSCR